MRHQDRESRWRPFVKVSDQFGSLKLQLSWRSGFGNPFWGLWGLWGRHAASSSRWLAGLETAGLQSCSWVALHRPDESLSHSRARPSAPQQAPVLLLSICRNHSYHHLHQHQSGSLTASIILFDCSFFSFFLILTSHTFTHVYFLSYALCGSWVAHPNPNWAAHPNPNWAAHPNPNWAAHLASSL